MKRILSIILFAAGVFGVGQAKEQLSPDQTLWFTSPAENWAQQALHIGNGYMGASFYGSVNRERFDIAEKTFWRKMGRGFAEKLSTILLRRMP